MIKRLFALLLCFLVLPLSGARWMVWNNASTFTPASLTSLNRWFEADTQIYKDAGVTPCTADGDLIQQWNNLAGGGNLTQATSGLRPTYKTGIANGKPSVAFFYPGSTASFLDESQDNNDSPVSIGMVVRSSTLTTVDNSLYGGAGAGNGLSLDSSSSKFRILKQGAALIGATTSTYSNSTFYIVIATYDSSGNYTLQVNGTADGSGTNLQAFASASGTRIGTYAAGTTLPLNGDILAIAVGAAVWSGTEKTNLNNYWRAKYATY